MEPLRNEPDRYELREAPAYDFAPSRREFFYAAGFLIFLTRGAPSVQAQDRKVAHVQVAADGAVKVFTGKVEFGQGARTELAMAVAEELRRRGLIAASALFLAGQSRISGPMQLPTASDAAVDREFAHA